ncbi:MAG: YfhL family 4Fe-4S dicluster ferredoxin [Dehalococcoidia bacterium]|nr:YfhL family 4Fe-4S dicluster ferredoxin [Dehalococcoidia bacterium]
MAYKITDECISCGACEAECPNEAITEGSSIFIINPDKCTECVGANNSSQCAAVCPVDACVADPKHTESKKQLLEKWRKIHSGKEPSPGTY